jgi:hypothetical protein
VLVANKNALYHYQLICFSEFAREILPTFVPLFLTYLDRKYSIDDFNDTDFIYFDLFHIHSKFQPGGFIITDLICLTFLRQEEQNTEHLLC